MLVNPEERRVMNRVLFLSLRVQPPRLGQRHVPRGDGPVRVCLRGDGAPVLPLPAGLLGLPSVQTV